MSWLTEFQKAYDAVPSQDNEGYVPDRGAFKCGFHSAWHSQQQIIYTLQTQLNSSCTVDNRHCADERNASLAENEALKAKLAIAVSALEDIHMRGYAGIASCALAAIEKTK